jgi:hypothetical protein
MHLAAWRRQVWVAMRDCAFLSVFRFASRGVHMRGLAPVFSATSFKGGFATRAAPASA